MILKRRFFHKKNKNDNKHDGSEAKSVSTNALYEDDSQRNVEESRELFYFLLQGFHYEFEYEILKKLGLKDEIDAHASELVRGLKSAINNISCEVSLDEIIEKLRYSSAETCVELVEQKFAEYRSCFHTQAELIISQYKKSLTECGALVSDDEYEAHIAALMEKDPFVPLEQNLPRIIWRTAPRKY